jgi:peptide/nickel transport system substrate-binding protein
VKRFIVVCLTASLLVLASCSPEKPLAPATSTAVADDTTPRDGGTLHRRLEADISSLNPILASTIYDRKVAHYLFTPLVYLDENLRPAPGLAESWEISPDGKLYTFKLNDKATFSDGTPVRASDVVFTLRKIVDPASEAVQMASNFEQLDLANTRAGDDHTVVVAFREALAAQMIRFIDVLVLPEAVYSQGSFRDAFHDKAVGSGPYRFVRRTPGKEVVVERRADYWGTRPHIQTVVFKIVGDHAVAWQAVRRGELDETTVTSDTWQHESRNPAFNGKIAFRRAYTLNYNYVGWNGRHPIFSDRRVRRAMSMCINLDTVINNLFHGTARAVSGPFTPEEWAFNPQVQPVKYDPAGAKQLLAESGWKDTNGDGILDKGGKPFKFDLILIAGGGPGRPFMQLLQQDLKNIGVQMEIAVLEGTSAIERILGGSYEAFYLAWELDPDPDVHAIFHSTMVPQRGQNFVFYSNPEADKLIDAGRRELDFGKRVDIYHRLHALLAADQPYSWTTQVSIKWALTDRVRGVRESHGYGLFLWYPGELGWWLADAGTPAATATATAR